MAVFKCKMCGGNIEFEKGATVGVCDSCGTPQTLPRIDDDQKANLYDRANHFRRNHEYDKAITIYEKILSEDTSDSEAYWSLVLCKYGIDYVEDPKTHKRVPTVNRAQFTSIFDDDNYKLAIQYADPSQKMIFEKEAKAINEIQKNILAISQKEEPFDVFICYKETDENSNRTQDSVLANELYYQLTNEGFKVFFARITLEDKLGVAYEPYIFAALNSAKVMVVIGTKPEYFNAVWVKNEWSRFLSIVKQSNGQKVLIPAYKDMDPYDLPEEFSHLQAQDMSKLGFMQDLIRGIKKIVNKDKVKEKSSESSSSTSSFAPLLKRAFLFLEDSDWSNADSYGERVLDLNPECAEAYVVKLLVSLHVQNIDALKNQSKPFEDNVFYSKAYRFADDKLKKQLESANSFIKERNENARLESGYCSAFNLKNVAKYSKDYYKAYQAFLALGEYKDSASQADECYQEFLSHSSKEKQQEEERERAEEERQKKIEEEEKRKNRVKLKILIVLTAILTIYLIVHFTIIKPRIEYKKAVEAFEALSVEERIRKYPEMVEMGYPLPELTLYDGKEKVQTISVLPGKEIELPVLDDKKGLHFLGWSNENISLTVKGKMPLESQDIYAQYGYFIKYVDVDGTEVGTSFVIDGQYAKLNDSVLSSVTQLPNVGWRDKNGKVFDKNATIDYVIDSDIEMYPVYEIHINAYMPDGTVSKSAKLGYDETFDIPTLNPENGYIGWSYSDDLDTIYTDSSFSVKKSTSIILRSKYVAKFTNEIVSANSFSQEFFLDKGIYIKNGTHIEKQGYEWLGWGYEDRIQNEGITIRPKDSVEFVAVYIPIEYAEKSTSYISFYVDTTQGIITSLPKKVSEVKNIIKYSVPDKWFSINKNNGAFSISSEYSNKKANLKYLAVPSQFNGTTVKCIADNGFKDCTNLVYITLPYTLEKFGTSAFANCKKLVSQLTIYPRITFIGTNAFNGSSIVFDSIDLTGCTSSGSVGTNAFTGTTVKKLVVNNNGVRSYSGGYTVYASSDKYPFYNVKGFETLVLKGNDFLNVMSSSMKSSVNTVEGLANITRFGDSVLENTYNLKTELSLTNKVTYIGENAFRYSGVTFTSVDLSGCTSSGSVGTNAFTGTMVKKLIVDNNGVRSYSGGYTVSASSDSYPFYNAKGFETLEIKSGTKTMPNVLSASMRKTMTNIIGFNRVSAYASEVLKDTSSLKMELSIYSSVTSIGNDAFSGSGVMFTSVDLSGCTSSGSVGTNAFTGTTVKKLVVNNNGVRSYSGGYTVYASSDKYPFYNVKGFETLVLKGNDFLNVMSSSMKSSVNTVEGLANITRFGDSVLENTYNLKTELSLTNKVTYIGENAFRYSGVTFTSVDLSGCTSSGSVGTNAFTGTMVKKLIVDNNGVRSYSGGYTVSANSDKYPFYNVNGFETLEIKSGTKTMPNVLSNSMRTTISNFVATKTLKEISNNAFENCKKLTKITLPYGVKTYENTFKGCNASISYTL